MLPVADVALRADLKFEGQVGVAGDINMFGDTTINRALMMLVKVFSGGLIVMLSMAMLITPSVMVLAAWGDGLNFVVAIAVICSVLFSGIFMPRARRWMAFFASILIAVPPFPYWIAWNKVGGYEFSFFYGFSISDIPFLLFLLVFVLSIILFELIFLSVSLVRRSLLNRPMRGR